MEFPSRLGTLTQQVSHVQLLLQNVKLRSTSCRNHPSALSSVVRRLFGHRLWWACSRRYLNNELLENSIATKFLLGSNQRIRSFSQLHVVQAGSAFCSLAAPPASSGLGDLDLWPRRDASARVPCMVPCRSVQDGKQAGRGSAEVSFSTNGSQVD